MSTAEYHYESFHCYSPQLRTGILGFTLTVWTSGHLSSVRYGFHLMDMRSEFYALVMLKQPIPGGSVELVCFHINCQKNRVFGTLLREHSCVL